MPVARALEAGRATPTAAPAPWVAMPDLRVQRTTRGVVAGTVPAPSGSTCVVDGAVPGLRGSWTGPGAARRARRRRPPRRRPTRCSARTAARRRRRWPRRPRGPGADGRATGDRDRPRPHGVRPADASGREVVLTHELAHVAVRASTPAGRPRGSPRGTPTTSATTGRRLRTTNRLAPSLGDVHGAGPDLPRLTSSPPVATSRCPTSPPGRSSRSSPASTGDGLRRRGRGLVDRDRARRGRHRPGAPRCSAPPGPSSTRQWLDHRRRPRLTAARRSDRALAGGGRARPGSGSAAASTRRLRAAARDRRRAPPPARTGCRRPAC